MLFGKDEPFGVTKLMGEKNPASSSEGGADLGPNSGVFSSLSSSLLALWPGRWMGESCDLALFFLSFLPGAGELVGGGSLTLGVANRSTGGRSVSD